MTADALSAAEAAVWSSPPLVVVGDALLDIDLVGRVERVCPDAPVPVLQDATEWARPGGAALAAALAAGHDREVVLITPLADDEDGERLRELLAGRVRLIALPAAGRTAVKRRIRAGGQSLLRIDGGTDRLQVRSLPAAVTATLEAAGAVLVSDYGRGATAVPELRAILQAVARRVPVVWDPHPRGTAPVPNVRLATPNVAEAAQAAEGAGRPAGPSGAAGLAAIRAYADVLVEHWRAAAVAVTMGPRGALVSLGLGTPLVVPARAGCTGDPCGAGDSFAATAALRLAAGALPTEAVTDAVAAASDFVAAGGAAGWSAGGAERQPRPAAGEAEQVLGRVRASGGTTVATGGCFDVLHAGHVATLRHARSLGDCLVVCLNSDESIRRSKGPGRPLVPVADRASVLLALSCVDAVAVFEEPTPETVLARLRPDVWVKGGDYVATTLPEAELLGSWGGQVVAVPFLPGRSSTGLIARLIETTEEQLA